MLLSSLYTSIVVFLTCEGKLLEGNLKGFLRRPLLWELNTGHLVKHQLYSDFLGALSTRTEVSTPFV